MQVGPLPRTTSAHLITCKRHFDIKPFRPDVVACLASVTDRQCESRRKQVMHVQGHEVKMQSAIIPPRIADLPQILSIV